MLAILFYASFVPLTYIRKKRKKFYNSEKKSLTIRMILIYFFLLLYIIFLLYCSQKKFNKLDFLVKLKTLQRSILNRQQQENSK